MHKYILEVRGSFTLPLCCCLCANCALMYAVFRSITSITSGNIVATESGIAPSMSHLCLGSCHAVLSFNSRTTNRVELWSLQVTYSVGSDYRNLPTKHTPSSTRVVCLLHLTIHQTLKKEPKEVKLNWGLPSGGVVLSRWGFYLLILEQCRLLWRGTSS